MRDIGAVAEPTEHLSKIAKGLLHPYVCSSWIRLIYSVSQTPRFKYPTDSRRFVGAVYIQKGHLPKE